MKKITTVAMLLALFIAPLAMGATTTEQETVPDESQGLLINGFWDNWYISIDGGAGVFFSNADENISFSKRIVPNAGLNFGKWWTPVFGTRIGLDYMGGNGATFNPEAFGFQNSLVDGYSDLYHQKHYGLRPHLDGMVDLVNLFGGYSPTRVYSLIIYAGFGYGYGWTADQPINEGFWCTELRGGLINSFHVSKAIDINLELKLNKYDSAMANEEPFALGCVEANNLHASVNVGVAFKFNESGWNAPVIPVVVPVVPKYSDAEGDALVARLQEANNRIKVLEGELAAANEALARAEAELANCKAQPAVTVYFNINESNIRPCDKKLVKAIAEALKADPESKYVVTGYADKETGTDAFNAKLREARAQSVYKMLVKNGVNPDQLQVATSTEPLNKYNYVLDRAVTIALAK